MALERRALQRRSTCQLADAGLQFSQRPTGVRGRAFMSEKIGSDRQPVSRALRWHNYRK
jgi:hypothetical protein